MKTRHIFRFIPLLALSTTFADTIELKDGTTYEGTVVKEDGEDYIVEIQVTKSIRDERRIPRADVLRIVAERKDETEFEALPKLVPAPDLLTEAEYDARISQVEAYLRKYPRSLKKNEASKILEQLETERKAVADGGVKFGGKIIPASERNPQAYALDARIAAAKVQRHGDAGEMLAALRSWTEFEKEFQGSSAYLDTIPYGTKLMRSYLKTVTDALNSFDARVQDRRTGLSRMSPSDRTRAEQVITEEQAAYQRRVEAEKASGMKWLSLDPFVRQPIEETKRQLESEIRRLENLNSASLPKIEEAYAEAWEALTKQGATQQEIDAAYSKARGAQIPAKYLEILADSATVPPTQR